MTKFKQPSDGTKSPRTSFGRPIKFSFKSSYSSEFESKVDDRTLPIGTKYSTKDECYMAIVPEKGFGDKAPDSKKGSLEKQKKGSLEKQKKGSLEKQKKGSLEKQKKANEKEKKLDKKGDKKTVDKNADENAANEKIENKSDEKAEPIVVARETAVCIVDSVLDSAKNIVETKLVDKAFKEKLTDVMRNTEKNSPFAKRSDSDASKKKQKVVINEVPTNMESSEPKEDDPVSKVEIELKSLPTVNVVKQTVIGPSEGGSSRSTPVKTQPDKVKLDSKDGARDSGHESDCPKTKSSD